MNRQCLTCKQSKLVILTVGFVLVLPKCFSRTTTQQEEKRAKYVVIGAMQEKKTIITKARGEAESAEFIGTAVKKNTGIMKLRRIDAAREIADIVAASGNKVYLNADSLLLNLLSNEAEDRMEKSVSSKRWI